MDTLPPELFIDIIDSVIGQPPRSGINLWSKFYFVPRLVLLEQLAIVSKSWREIIHNQPLLWSTVSSSDPLSHVEKAIRRSVDAPLKVYISQLPFSPDFYTAEEQFTTHCQRFLQLVGEHLDRWVLVDWMIPFTSMLDLLPTMPAPNLKSLSLSAQGEVVFPRDRFKWERTTRPPNLFGGVVPLVQSLSLNMTRLGWSISSYANLRSLTIICETYSNTITGDYILDVLEAASPRLESLAFLLNRGDYSGSNTGHATEIEETASLVAITKERNPRIQMRKLRSLTILDLQDLEDVITHFDVPACTYFELSTLPTDWSKVLEDPEYIASTAAYYQTLDAVHRRWFTQVIAAITDPDDVVCRLVAPGRYWPSWREAELSISSKSSKDVRFTISRARVVDCKWVLDQLPGEFRAQKELELHLAQRWDAKGFEVCAAHFEADAGPVIALVVVDGSSAPEVLQALGERHPLEAGGQTGWLLPSLTDLELRCRASEDIVELVRTVVKRRSIPGGGHLPAARITRVEMRTVEAGDAERMTELRAFLEAM